MINQGQQATSALLISSLGLIDTCCNRNGYTCFNSENTKKGSKYLFQDFHTKNALYLHFAKRAHFQRLRIAIKKQQFAKYRETAVFMCRKMLLWYNSENLKKRLLWVWSGAVWVKELFAFSPGLNVATQSVGWFSP